MIARIIEASARNRVLVLLFAVALAVAGWNAVTHIPLDAIPDLSDTQVVVFAEWPGRTPTLMEDQVTWPLVTGLLGTAGVVDVRAQTMLGMSFVYVIFEEGTDLYWARSRVQEAMGSLQSRLPAEVTPRLGPDATGIGWVYQYALVDRSGQRDLGALRALHDYTLRYALAAVPGVSEVATVGGYEMQWQVTVDPTRLRGYGLTLTDVADAVRASNGEVGGRVIELSQREHAVRGTGWIRGAADLERAALRATRGGTPVLIRDVATVRMGSALRRGAADLNGEGEVVSGVVVMRLGENARAVIQRVEQRIAELRRTLPAGVEVVPVYDRKDLVERAIDTLRHALTEEMIVVSVVILGFLLHLRSALMPVISLPLAVLVAFIPMYLLRIPATIMSLGGIAIAVGATVDAEIVMIEAAHKKLEGAPADLPAEERARLLAEAAKEVTPAIVSSLLIMATSFIPVFGLDGQAGRLFRPLAWTKTFVMLSAALLSVTVAPALRDLLIRGKILSEARHPVSRVIRAFYEPFVHVALRNPKTTVLIGLMAVCSALPLIPRLGREFMPPLDEGDLLYMPSTLPGVSIEEARRQLQRQDAVLRTFPEVISVLGKAGRAETPTDPAPLSMIETVIRLRPRAQWRTTYVRRWYVGRTPTWMRGALARLWPEFVPMSRDQLLAEMHRAMSFPGWVNAWTQPIRNRVDMQSTGIRTVVGLKVHGDDLAALEGVGAELERSLRGIRGTRSVLLERSLGGMQVDIDPDRDALARFGLPVDAVHRVVEAALGGAVVTTTLDGRVRIGVQVRLSEDARTRLDVLRELPVALPGEAPAADGLRRTVPLGTVARIHLTRAPTMVRDDGGTLVSYVYVDLDPERDVGGWVTEAQALVRRLTAQGAIRLPPGVWVEWTGQWRQLTAMEARMKLLVPLALLVVILLLYWQFKNLTEVLIVLLSVPFALVGSVWALYLLDYHVSTAVWVGVIALVGLATQTGVVMIVYIDHAYERRLAAGQIQSLDDIVEAHAEGTVQRVRPKLMTVGTMLFGLVPLLWSEGSGADVMKRIAAPMVGGLITSAFLTLEIIPVIYTYWRNEQRVWRLLALTRDARLAWLSRLSSAAGAGALGALGTLAWPLYAAAPGWLPAARSVTLGLAVAASVGYVAVRKSVVEAAADAGREGETQ
ncbi:MAG: efflux RND transporter permease subunit [Polyangiales bacterium]